MTAHASRFRWGLAALAVATIALISGSLFWPGLTGEPTAGQGSGPAPGADSVACLGYVDVEDGVVALAPLQAGRVAQVRVREGEAVPVRAVLLELDDGDQKLRLEEAETAREAARAQLALAREGPSQHRSRLVQQECAVEAAGRRVSVARLNVGRQQELFDRQMVNVRDVRVAETQVQELEALEKAEAERLADLRRHNPETEVRRAEAELALAEVRVKQARKSLEDCVLRAPRAGTVLRLLAHPGDLAAGPAGAPVLLFCSEAPRIVRAEIEQEFAGRLTAGQPARVEDDASPGTLWYGRVVRVADWYSQRRAVLQEPPARHDVRTVECLIALEADRPPPRLGLRVQVLIGPAALSGR